MNVITEMIHYVVTHLLSVFALLVMLRFVLQWVRADFYNPLSQGIVKITNPPLKLLHRIIPSFWGLDIAALLLVFMTHVIILVFTLLLSGNNPLPAMMNISAIAALKIFISLLNIATASLLISITLSFIAPMTTHPMAIIVRQISEPLMRPFRKLLPDMGGIDLSPIFVFLAIGVISRIIALAGQGLGIPIGQMWMFLFI